MRISPKILWSDELEMKLASLEYGPDALNTDSLLCQLVRAERLCQQYVSRHIIDLPSIAHKATANF